MSVSVDGGNLEDRDLLLCCIGNGGYCGGGFNSNPRALLSDGLLDACLVKNVSRTKFLSLLGSYKNGSFLEKKGIEKTLDYIKCRSLEMKLSRKHWISVDGELIESDHLSISSHPGGLRFILPRGSTLKKEHEMATAGV